MKTKLRTRNPRQKRRTVAIEYQIRREVRGGDSFSWPAADNGRSEDAIREELDKKILVTP
jgi:hypothetical protein